MVVANHRHHCSYLHGLCIRSICAVILKQHDALGVPNGQKDGQPGQGPLNVPLLIKRVIARNHEVQ